MSWQVHELLGNMESAALLYSKAVWLLVFLLVEAPSLILNPPFSLTNSDRYRLRTYIDILNKGYSRSQRMSLLNCKDQSWSIYFFLPRCLAQFYFVQYLFVQLFFAVMRIRVLTGVVKLYKGWMEVVILISCFMNF